MLSVHHLNLVVKAQKTLYQDWQHTILRGNQQFEGHDIYKAMATYQTAVSLAEQLLTEGEEFHMAVVALIVSRHNLADVMLAQSLADSATDEFLAAHQHLLALQSRYIEEPNKQEALMWGLRRTYTALLLHLKDHNRSKIIEVPQMPVFFAGDGQFANQKE